MSDAKAATTCKRIAGQIKLTRARIKRLTTTPPGPQRQKERLNLAGDLSLIAAALYGVAADIGRAGGHKGRGSFLSSKVSRVAYALFWTSRQDFF